MTSAISDRADAKPATATPIPPPPTGWSSRDTRAIRTGSRSAAGHEVRQAPLDGAKRGGDSPARRSPHRVEPSASVSQFLAQALKLALLSGAALLVDDELPRAAHQLEGLVVLALAHRLAEVRITGRVDDDEAQPAPELVQERRLAEHVAGHEVELDVRHLGIRLVPHALEPGPHRLVHGVVEHDDRSPDRR